MGTIYKYRIWCETDGKYEFVWSETPPTKCPSDTGHTINTNKTIVVDKREESLITIKEENIPTGGHYQACFHKITVPSGSSYVEHDIVFPHPISLLAAEWTNTTANAGDEIEFQVAPGTIIGTLASGVPSGTLVMPVSQTVVDNLGLGYHADLLSASGACDIGRVSDINDEDNTITVEIPADQDFAAGTYFRMHLDMVRRSPLAGFGRVQLGEAKIGGSYIPAGTILRACYWNNNDTQKELIFVLEYLY